MHCSAVQDCLLTCWCHSILSAGTALAFFSTISLTCQLFYTFRSYRSLYFWSLAITSWSLSLHALGLLLIYVGDRTQYRLHLAILFIGWISMTTGFSIVLYSRLHILDTSRRWRRSLLMMIAIVALLVHPTSVVMETVPSLPSQFKEHEAWLTAWSIWHRVRPAIFLVVDFILTSFYIKAALEFIKQPASPSRWLSMRQNRQVTLLISMQVIVWVLDLALVGCALAKLFILIDLLTSFVYAVKLKLEFVFLTQLVAMSSTTHTGEIFIAGAMDEEVAREMVAPQMQRQDSELHQERAYITPIKES